MVLGESLEDEQIVGNRSKGVVFEGFEGRDKIFIINFAICLALRAQKGPRGP
jgi:hypothetical protein